MVSKSNSQIIYGQILINYGTIILAANKTVRPVAPDEYLISPITGERIPASKVQEHMRIGLLDPRWVEQRDKHLDKLAQETVFCAWHSNRG